MRLSTHLGLSLNDCLTKHTHRQYRAWMCWLDNQWNKPSRSDHYLMQIAMEVRRVLHKEPKKVTLELFKIPFKWTAGEVASARKALTKEEAAAWAKAKWFGMLGTTGKALGVKRKE